MLVKEITYTDFNGKERKEKFLFNLNKSELVKMELSAEGGYAERLQSIVDAKGNAEIMTIFEKIILAAYGEKSEDGKRFMKSAEISEAFSQTAAYDQLFIELITDADAAAKFINAIIPDEVKPDHQAIPAPPVK